MAREPAMDELGHARRELGGEEQPQLVADTGEIGRQSYFVESAAHPMEGSRIADPQAGRVPPMMGEEYGSSPGQSCQAATSMLLLYIGPIVLDEIAATDGGLLRHGA